MFFKFCVTRSKKTKFSSLSQRLGACFSSRVLCLAAAFIAAVALLPSVASATFIVPDADFDRGIGGDSARLDFPGAGTVTIRGATATATGLPGPLVSGHGAGDKISSLTASALIQYWFGVAGPPGDVVVPLLVTVTMHGRVSGPARAEARFFVIPFGAEIVIDDVVPSVAAGPFVFDFSGTLPFTVISGPPATSSPSFSATRGGLIRMDVTAGARDGGVADAFVDPFIFIDPVFLSTHPGYSVIVSAGIGNVAPAGPRVPGVPEPATLVLVGLGLAGMGLSRRRNQRKS